MHLVKDGRRQCHASDLIVEGVMCSLTKSQLHLNPLTEINIEGGDGTQRKMQKWHPYAMYQLRTALIFFLFCFKPNTCIFIVSLKCGFSQSF